MPRSNGGANTAGWRRYESKPHREENRINPVASIRKASAVSCVAPTRFSNAMKQARTRDARPRRINTRGTSPSSTASPAFVRLSLPPLLGSSGLHSSRLQFYHSTFVPRSPMVFASVFKAPPPASSLLPPRPISTASPVDGAPAMPVTGSSIPSSRSLTRRLPRTSVPYYVIHLHGEAGGSILRFFIHVLSFVPCIHHLPLVLYCILASVSVTY